MINIILGFLNKNIFGIIFATVLLIITITIFNNKLQKQKLETERYQRNLVNSKFNMDLLTNKLGEDEIVIHGLSITTDDLSKLNDNLTNQLKNSNLKINDLTNVITQKNQYIFELGEKLEQHFNVIDSLVKSDSLNNYYKEFIAEYKDEWLKIKQSIILYFPEEKDDLSLKEYIQKSRLEIDNFFGEIDSKITTASEIEYRPKKWWQFWKKKLPIGIKTHIITNNPYFKVDSIEVYQFIR
jgi:hypothetical protein